MKIPIIISLLNHFAMLPRIIPTPQKSTSEKVVLEKPSDPKTGNKSTGKKVTNKPLAKAPSIAPRRPPIALPNTPAVAPIKKGYRHIGLLCADHQCHVFQQRLHGWHKAMLNNHLPTHRIINPAKPANFSTGSALLPDILLNWPEIDALVCTTDELACGVLYECQRRHIRVPYQLAVCGFGDSEFSQVSIPTLTTISLPSKRKGEYIGNLLLNKLTDRKDNSNFELSTLKPTIYSRDSL